ncbi:hypothetical protein K440DRAFT_244216 [Wilcoxina mikolae CBS 423.85]|nr:hypothetical protein K440DRAFT_244216 [Wilcoxina mikolae CBS 423.85]
METRTANSGTITNCGESGNVGSPRPARRAATIRAEGFTVLQEGESDIADVIFIHGLQGNPRDTWVYSGGTTEVESQGTSQRRSIRSLFTRTPKVTSTVNSSSSVSAAEDVFSLRIC